MNKPVAWMALNELNGSYSTFTDDQKQRLLPHVSQCYGKWIPLYTHPVKELTKAEGFALTDEEIMEVCFSDGIYDCINDPYMKSNGQYSLDGDLLKFAKAILRKAQEK